MMRTRMMVAACGLLAATLASTLPAGAQSTAPGTAPGMRYVEEPTGDGTPGAVTCREGQTLPRSRLLGPVVCRTNADWAQLRKDGMDISPDGRSTVPSEKYRSLNEKSCIGTYTSGTSQNGGLPMIQCN